MNIFDFKNYKAFIRSMIASHPDLGRGSIKKMAEALRVHPSLISQVLNGIKDFTSEQANDIATFFCLTEVETEYFLCLVDIERAGTTRLKAFLQSRLSRLAGAAAYSHSGTEVTHQNSDTGLDNSPATVGLENKVVYRQNTPSTPTSAVSRRHSRTVSVSLSDHDKKHLQTMIDNFATKISAAGAALNSNQISVVTIDLFEIG
jgi:hypothetical protein